MDDLEVRIDELQRDEEVRAIRPDLSGHQIMTHLGIPPGPTVGAALEFLLELRLEEGPVGEEGAYRRLDTWWEAREGRA
jgi:poly(A) polymerase